LHNFIYYVHKKGESMKKIAILASGEGTNAERIIRYFSGHATVEVAVVIASRPTARVVERAHILNVPCGIIIPQDFAAGKGLEVLKSFKVDFVVLAGFLSRIPEDILHDYAHKIVNIHPSLLPKFGGKGMYGMHVHEAVLASGEHESGITIQYINEHYDQGDIIFQAKCPVLSDDTAETLAQRVHALEYSYYPQVIERLLSFPS